MPSRTRRETHCDEPMAKPKTEKKAAIAAPVSRVLPMDLQLGDRLVDERGEWRVSCPGVSVTCFPPFTCITTEPSSTCSPWQDSG